MSLSAEAAAETVAERIREGVFRVASVERDAVRRDPVPPFTTVTLQQEASRRLGFGVRRTMSVAEGLYEGVALDGGGRPRASAVAAALRTFGFGAAPPGAGLAPAPAGLRGPVLGPHPRRSADGNHSD